MPNVGASDPKSLMNMIQQYGERKLNKIYTTIIGIGIDFNVDLTEKISKVRGANYFAVHSNEAFKKRMKEEFKYMVSPLLFNLNLDVSAEGNEYVFDEIYGINKKEEKENGTNKNVNLVNVKSLFT